MSAVRVGIYNTVVQKSSLIRGRCSVPSPLGEVMCLGLCEKLEMFDGHYLWSIPSLLCVRRGSWWGHCRHCLWHDCRYSFSPRAAGGCTHFHRLVLSSQGSAFPEHMLHIKSQPNLRHLSTRTTYCTFKSLIFFSVGKDEVLERFVIYS